MKRKGRRRGGMTPFVAGALALILIAIGTYFGFSKHIPFTHDFRLRAVFSSAVSIRNNSPVRIAGVNVGKVTGVSRYKDSDMSVVDMQIQDKGLPIHDNATLKIRPRIFLEGNFFVDVSPGTPDRPDVKENGTIGPTQTSTPVQLDEVLTALQSDTRGSLQTLLDDYAKALSNKATTGEDPDPEVAGLTGAQALNRAARYGGDAFKYGSLVNEAFLGLERHDVSKQIGGLAKIVTALDDREGSLKDLITNFNRTVAATAAERGNLQATIRLLPPTLTQTDRTLTALNRSFPPTRAFAREILPGVRETPATIDAAFPWIRQVRGLLGPDELRGLARVLRPTTADLARLTDITIPFLKQGDLVAKCVDQIILPTGNVVINDTNGLGTGVENYKEFWYSMVGLASEGQNTDGNGMYVRFQPGGGTQTVSTGNSTLSGDKLFANATAKPIGTRPAFPGRRPPYRPDFPCYRNKRADINGPAGLPGSPDDSKQGATGSTGSTGILGLPVALPTTAKKLGVRVTGVIAP